MKRTALAFAFLSLTVLTALTAGYYSFPNYLHAPLVELNRWTAGLSEKTVTVQSHQVHYLEGGSGEPVILLHGIFGEKDHWVDFARHLEGGYRVIVPDLPGFGKSGRLRSEAYDYAAQTERLKSLLDALGIRRAHFAGNSMGGTIAALFAIRHPDRSISVSFVGAPHGIRSRAPSEMDRLIDAGKSPLVARNDAEFAQMMSLLFVERPFLPYPVLHAARAEATRNAASNQRLWQEQLKDRHLLHKHIAQLRVPVLALWGSGDLVFDVTGTEVLRSQLHSAQVHVLPGVGHLPMMEAPGLTSRMYSRFLDTLNNSAK